MQARLKSGLVSAVPASQIVGSIKALVSMLETQIVSDNVVLFGVSANYMKQYCGSNVKGQSISVWKATAVWNVTPEKAEEEVEEDEIMRALREMESGGGIDAFEMARKGGGKGVIPDPDPEPEQPKSIIGLSKADKELLGLHDPRPSLSKAMLLTGYVWFCMFSCKGILDKTDRACGKCCSKRESSCVCDGCGTKYDVNRQVVCTMCERHLPHSDKYTQQQSNLELHDALSGEKKKSRSAVSRSKLKEQISNSVLIRMLNDSRGSASTSSGMVQTTYELADMIGAMTTSVASNKQAASTPVEFLTCPLVAEMIEDLSNFRFGGLGEGLSIWQCLPYEGEWKSALYYSSNTDLNAFNSSGKAKRTSKAELLKLRQYLTIERFDAMVENYATAFRVRQLSSWS